MVGIFPWISSIPTMVGEGICVPNRQEAGRMWSRWVTGRRSAEPSKSALAQWMGFLGKVSSGTGSSMDFTINYKDFLLILYPKGGKLELLDCGCGIKNQVSLVDYGHYGYVSSHPGTPKWMQAIQQNEQNPPWILTHSHVKIPIRRLTGNHGNTTLKSKVGILWRLPETYSGRKRLAFSPNWHNPRMDVALIVCWIFGSRGPNDVGWYLLPAPSSPSCKWFSLKHGTFPARVGWAGTRNSRT